MKFKNQACLVIINICIVLTMAITFGRISEKNKIEGRNDLPTYESIVADHNVVTLPANVCNDNLAKLNKVEENIMPKAEKQKGRNISEEDKYLLAKIAMAEAEGESLETKILVIIVVLNRVDADTFPDTISEVIFQKSNGVYQFSPIGDGRWYRVEPNEECWEAVNIVCETDYDISQGALFFEACSGESWHSRNLEFICQSDNTRFYK